MSFTYFLDKCNILWANAFRLTLRSVESEDIKSNRFINRPARI